MKASNFILGNVLVSFCNQVFRLELRRLRVKKMRSLKFDKATEKLNDC